MQAVKTKNLVQFIFDCHQYNYLLKLFLYISDEIWRKLEPLALSEDGQLVIVHSVSDLRDEENADCEDEHDLETFKSFVMEFIASKSTAKSFGRRTFWLHACLKPSNQKF